MSEEGGVIFGTNISTGRVFRDIEIFIKSYETSRLEGEDVISELIYQQKFNDMGLDIGGDVFEVKATHIKDFSQ